MRSAESKRLDMLHGPIWSKLPQFALPVAATAILEQLFNASDIAVVGNFTGADKTIAVAAVGANSALIALIACDAAVLVKGGHGTQDASDVLVEPSGKVTWFRARRINNPNTHGTGCTLSSAIASHLALGETLPEAVNSAKLYLTGALEAQLDLGHGSGPMDHAWQWR